ncbi:hypothetical protein ABZT08_13440 [Streptomyces sp. NPDC005526]|uniref:hypothetical protein n=1 Tax=Streptomyces sp. NPDC005526 TaxID=3156885 RepID=UPI0033B3D444
MGFLGNDGAIVVGESSILFVGETEVPDTRKIYAPWVLEKRDGNWYIAAYHNSASTGANSPSGSIPCSCLRGWRSPLSPTG